MHNIPFGYFRSSPRVAVRSVSANPKGGGGEGEKAHGMQKMTTASTALWVNGLFTSYYLHILIDCNSTPTLPILDSQIRIQASLIPPPGLIPWFVRSILEGIKRVQT